MEYPYTVIRSKKRKTMAITVKQNLSVEVRVPMRVSQKIVDAFVEQNQDWIAVHIEKQRSKNMAAQIITPAEEQALRQKAKAYLPERVAYYSAKMGLSPTGFRVTGAKTRLGSCSAKDSLNFSFRLMVFPPEAIDYVVVHELAHIRHKNHGPDFYRLIEQYMPDYKERNAILRDPQYRIL